MEGEEKHSSVAEIVKSSLGFFVEQYKPSSLSFPLLPNTFTLWRNYAYRQVTRLPLSAEDHTTISFYFYLESQCGLLPQFLQKVLGHLSNSSSRLLHFSAETGQSNEHILEKYNRALQLHSLYHELLLDIISLPYLRQIFPEKTSYQLKQEFCPDIVSEKQEGEVGRKIQANLFNKGFGILAEKIFSKTFIIRASSLAIRLNPVCMVASFAFGELLTKYQKDKRGQEFQAKLLEALARTEAKAEKLKSIYEQCLGLLGPALRLRGESLKNFVARIKDVLVQDWLHVQKRQDEDGWQVIQLRSAGLGGGP